MIGIGTRGIPLADERALASGRRRALAGRLLWLGVFAALAAALALATRHALSPAAAPRATSGTVVLVDVSGSITPAASATIVRVLRAVGHGGGHAGLVLFSDATEEVVPPTAPASELLRYVPLFDARGLGRNPWSVTFSAGTQIGRGLGAAREALQRARIPHGKVILVSDVDDSLEDLPVERRELLDYVRDPSLELRLVTVPDFSPQGVQLYRHVLGTGAVAVARPPAEVAVSPGSGFPWLPVALVLAAAGALAAYELSSAPLSWREVPA